MPWVGTVTWGCTPSRLAQWRRCPTETSALFLCRAQQGGLLAELTGMGPQVQTPHGAIRRAASFCCLIAARSHT